MQYLVEALRSVLYVFLVDDLGLGHIELRVLYLLFLLCVRLLLALGCLARTVDVGLVIKVGLYVVFRLFIIKHHSLVLMN